jgi:hypothetical protein
VPGNGNSVLIKVVTDIIYEYHIERSNAFTSITATPALSGQLRCPSFQGFTGVAKGTFGSGIGVLNAR